MRSRIRSGLLQRGMPSHVADAFIMNMQDESGLNPGINEIAPLVPGSRGGFGLYQLTGPRRRQYEAFAQQRGVPAADVDAQLDFLMHELETTESRAAKNIFAAQDTGSAAAAIVNDFLRPAEQHRAKRVARYTGNELTGGGSSDTLVGGLSINPAAVPDLLEAAPMQAEAPGGLLGRLFPDMSASRADEIRLGINGMLHNPNQGQQQAIMARMGQRQLDQREAKAEQKQTQQANKTAAWLAQQPGGQEYAAAIASGALPANAALQMWKQQGQGPEMTALQKQYAQDVAQGYQGTLLDYQLELKKAGASSTTINTGDQGQRMGTVPPGYTAVQDPSNPSGFRLEVIPGGPADQEQAAAAEQSARSQRASAENESTQRDVVLSTVDKIRTELNNPGIVPDVGVLGARTEGINQQARNISGMLDTLKGMVVFDRLEQLKAASATGASGLGQVTEREIALLGAQLGALDNTLSKDLILDTLNTVEETFGKMSPEAQAYLLGRTDQLPTGSTQQAVPDFSAMSDAELDAYIAQQEGR